MVQWGAIGYDWVRLFGLYFDLPPISMDIFSVMYVHNNVLAAQCSTKAGRLSLVVIYRPPKSTELCGEFDSLLNKIMAPPWKLLICGDCNSPSYITNVDITSQLKAVLIEHDLAQHVTSPTHRLCGLMLDLFITLKKNHCSSMPLTYVIWGFRIISLSLQR